MFIGFEPQAFLAHFKQDFVLPIDIPMSVTYTPSQSALDLLSQVSQSLWSQTQPSHTQSSQSQPSQSQPSSQQSEIESSEIEIVSSQTVPLQPTVFHLDPSQPTSYQIPPSQTRPSQPSQPSQSSQISVPVSLSLPPPLNPSKPPCLQNTLLHPSISYRLHPHLHPQLLEKSTSVNVVSIKLTVKMIGKTLATFILALSSHVVHVTKNFPVAKIELHISSWST